MNEERDLEKIRMIMDNHLGFRSTMSKNQSSLISSDDSFDKENQVQSNETLPSYSFLFDKVEHNFSTSSEISSVKPNKSPPFNPFLLLFMSDDPLKSIEVLDDDL